MQAECHTHASQREARTRCCKSKTMKTQSVHAVAALVLLGAALASALSIEIDPVRVTHRNSGPRYDIDEMERAKALMKEAASNGKPQAAQPAPAGSEGGREEGGTAEEVPVGHVAIRRVFLFPVMRPSNPDWAQTEPATAESGNQAGREQEGAAEPPMLFAKPFWPFMTPARPSPASHPSDGDERPHIIRHLFGADQASRSPSAERDQDKAASNQGGREDQPARPLFDPLQMMMDMMHQAINGHLGPHIAKDLSNKNKNNNNNNNNNQDGEASGDNSPAESSDERPLMPTGLFGPAKPGSQNETHEDIVEIEGRKYLRKTVMNRHVGDNIVFMTRRLVFIPLNETLEDATTAVTTTDLPAPTTTSASPATSAESDEIPSISTTVRETNRPAPAEQEPSSAPTSTSTTTTTTTTTEVPSTTNAQPEITTQPTPTPVTAEQPTSREPREEASRPKAAERLVEAPAEAPKPNASAA